MTRLTPDLYVRLRQRLADLGFGGDYEWAQGLREPTTAGAFACEFVWVVLNSGMKNTVARRIMDRVWPVLQAGGSARDVFGHKGKCKAIDDVYRRREEVFAAYRAAPDKLAFCESLDWIGGITKYHLAKNLGADVAKPDRWLQRLAAAEGETVDGLCRRLATATGDRVATVDLVLWRACAVGVLRVTPEGLTEAA